MLLFKTLHSEVIFTYEIVADKYREPETENLHTYIYIYIYCVADK